ncbi:hypothetical protein VTO42DRAFT_8688 [Malbranchea cinnamomea]
MSSMSVSPIDPKEYTHVHFAFPEITDDYEVDVSQVQAEFDAFVRLKGIKRILSLGGWSFSTELDSFPIFRKGVTPENRKRFAQNVVNFIKKHKLDGVDFDWEYPGTSKMVRTTSGSCRWFGMVCQKTSIRWPSLPRHRTGISRVSRSRALGRLSITLSR